MEEVFITVLLGTARKGRESQKVAKWITKILNSESSVTSELVDVKDMGYSETIPPWGEGGAKEKPTDWKGTVERSDGLLIVVPEYNRGYPGELKLALDSLYNEYKGKPVLVCGVSGGGFGGSRVVEHIQPVLNELKMIFVPPALYISNVADSFGENGPKDESFEERAKKSTNSLIHHARVLKGKDMRG